MVREILVAGASPLQSAVVKRYGGIEHVQYTDPERKLIEATFENPGWYRDTNAHYPLIITAMNKIESGELDGPYNQPDENYAARQGVSKRSTCPVYLAIKTEVLALSAAIDAGVEKDFYISDLWQILEKIYSHSKYDTALAKGAGGLLAPYTPYSYLMHEIASDFETLVEMSVRTSIEKNQGAPEDSKPSMTGETLVRMWCSSIWELMSEPNRIDPVLLDQIVERYFRLMFALGWQPTEVLYTSGQSVPSLNSWRDLFFEEFEDCISHVEQEQFTALHPVFKYLDSGKPFISEGYGGLKLKLDSSFVPN